MFITYYNKKLTNLQLKLFNFLEEEHNPALEFFISFLYCILEKSIRIVEAIKDIVIVPFKVLSFLIMLLFLVLFHLASNTNRNNHSYKYSHNKYYYKTYSWN